MSLYTERIFPWLLDQLEGREMEALRAECVRPAAGEVLEIGLGTGKSLPYYGDRVKSLTALEPSRGMNRRVQRRLQETNVPVKLVPLPGEQLPFDNESFEEVVVTMTMCSVTDPDRVLAGIYRVLRPGGRYRFLEHVASTRPRFRRVQNRLNVLSRLLGGGCNLNRDIEAVIQRAGFRFETLERTRFKGVAGLPELYPLIRGVAVKEA
jgi:ubiquinone/menaquinone biosynthesis C-methylase UbiE